MKEREVMQTLGLCFVPHRPGSSENSLRRWKKGKETGEKEGGGRCD
jgi:hypothetical protein